MAHQRPQMFEDPAAAGLVAAKLQPRLEVIRVQLSLHREETERISLWLIKRNRASVKWEYSLQCFGNGMQECLLGQIRDDGIVDLKQKAVLLFSFTQRRLRLFPLRDVLGKRHQKSRHTFGTRNQRNIIADPPQGAILASILFLDLKLL